MLLDIGAATDDVRRGSGAALGVPYECTFNIWLALFWQDRCVAGARRFQQRAGVWP